LSISVAPACSTSAVVGDDPACFVAFGSRLAIEFNAGGIVLEIVVEE
jgi:hypothetical protein